VFLGHLLVLHERTTIFCFSLTVSVYSDCRICVWNAADGSLVHCLTGHSESVTILYISTPSFSRPFFFFLNVVCFIVHCMLHLALSFVVHPRLAFGRY